ncbi:MAG: hypothetical protein Ta2E_12890 [Mycoplasmoidaceae bacterium]|nr:MAG: hypothetical protein Ta2E_12890 [Mycoplasmoidaceae bacterium]
MSMEELVKKINAQCTAIANEMDSVFKSFSNDINGLTNTLRHMEQAMMQDIQ